MRAGVCCIKGREIRNGLLMAVSRIVNFSVALAVVLMIGHPFAFGGTGRCKSQLRDLRPELSVAVSAVTEACRLCRKIRQETSAAGNSAVAVDAEVESPSTADIRPVAIARYSSLVVIVQRLMEYFPRDRIVGGENAGFLRSPEGAALRGRVNAYVQQVFRYIREDEILGAIDSVSDEGGAKDRRWILNPLDGRYGFVTGGHYAVCLALMIDGKIALGVLGLPTDITKTGDPNEATGVIFSAVRGAGATTADLHSPYTTRPIKVSRHTLPQDGIMVEPVRPFSRRHDIADGVITLLGIRSKLSMDSQAKYAVVAEGHASIYLQVSPISGKEFVWEHAAGYVIVTEAGGTVTDLDEKPLDFTAGKTLSKNVGVVATNGRLHKKVLEAVQTVLSTPR